MEEYFIGRQPIFNRKLETFGYELLYRSCEVNQALIDNRDQATIQVILNAFAEIGLAKLVGSSKAFINMTENHLSGDFSTIFPPDRLVLEVPETISINAQMIEAISRLKKQGFETALDDVVNTDIAPFLENSTYVKIDFLQVKRDKLGQLVNFFKKFPVKLIAEKVETQNDLDECLTLGFDYFQGNFLCKPRVSRIKSIPPNKAVLLNLISELSKEDITYSQLEEILSRDVALGYKLLQLVNSAYFGLDTRINSLRHAMALLGTEQLRRWLMLFLVVETSDKPHELIITAMIRARMCQLLAKTVGKHKPEEFFLVGLFSVLDAMYDLSMEELLIRLPLSDEIYHGLIDHKGDLGKCLECVLAYENSDWEHVGYQTVSSTELRSMFFESVEWAQVTNAMMTTVNR